MKIRFSFTINIKRKEKFIVEEPEKQGAVCQIEHAPKYTGPSMGFRVGPQEEE